ARGMRGGTTTKVDFRDAGRHEHELNERQREVLALVASGLTNGEIGERLGMTLDGAKWNVSEILTKLGLASREEAADYWRWRHGGVWSRVRGWLGAPLLKVAGAGAAVMVGVGVVAALMSEDEAAVVDEPGRPFYLEAEIRVSSNARTIGTNIAGPTPMADPDESRSVMRWAWRDADHYRFEIETTEPAIDAGSFLVVADGSRLWFHNEQEATYAEQELWPLPPGFRFRPVGISVMLGPVPFPGDVDTVDELTAAIEQWRPDDKDWVRMAGDDRMLGRAVVVIEMGPARCSSTQTWDADGSTTSAEECDGSSRLWVDPETMVILRHFVQSSTQSFDGVVTRLDYDMT
ncbi:MAG: response regulator transcription factor, partial [Tepidiformaceae bacterium]